MQVTTSTETLTTLANNIGFRVYISKSHKYSYTDSYYKTIVVSISEIETMASKYGLDVEDTKICCLSHEIGHVMALVNGENYADEVLAWRYASSLFQAVPDIFYYVREVTLKTYNLTYPTSQEEMDKKELLAIEAEISAFLDCEEFGYDC